MGASITQKNFVNFFSRPEIIYLLNRATHTHCQRKWNLLLRWKASSLVRTSLVVPDRVIFGTVELIWTQAEVGSSHETGSKKAGSVSEFEINTWVATRSGKFWVPSGGSSWKIVLESLRPMPDGAFSLSKSLLRLLMHIYGMLLRHTCLIFYIRFMEIECWEPFYGPSVAQWCLPSAWKAFLK